MYTVHCALCMYQVNSAYMYILLEVQVLETCLGHNAIHCTNNEVTRQTFALAENVCGHHGVLDDK